MADNSKEILFPDESYAINGAIYEVHKVLGTGFYEKVYGDALAIEFKKRNIPYEREVHLSLYYKGERLQHDFYADFVCYNKIIIELKSATQIEGKYFAQVINYLKATNYQLGLLVNFQQEMVKPLRITNSPTTYC